MNKSQKVTTPKGRFSYLTVFTPRAVSQENPDNKKYGVTLIFDKSQQAELQQIQALYNSNAQALRDTGKILNPHTYGADPFIDCDAYDKWTQADDYEAVYKGKLILRLGATENYPPKVLANNAQGTYDVVSQTANRIKSGDYGRCVVSAFGFSTPKNTGVSFGFELIVMDEEGEALGASSISVDQGAEMLGITIGDATGAGLPNTTPVQPAPAAPVQPAPAAPVQPAPAAPVQPAPAAPAAPQLTQVSVNAGYTYQSLLDIGWDDIQMRDAGYII